jgi:hypothetical protein
MKFNHLIISSLYLGLDVASLSSRIVSLIACGVLSVAKSPSIITHARLALAYERCDVITTRPRLCTALASAINLIIIIIIIIAK